MVKNAGMEKHCQPVRHRLISLRMRKLGEIFKLVILITFR
jgi:hypothetical protein